MKSDIPIFLAIGGAAWFFLMKTDVGKDLGIDPLGFVRNAVGDAVVGAGRAVVEVVTSEGAINLYTDAKTAGIVVGTSVNIASKIPTVSRIANVGIKTTNIFGNLFAPLSNIGTKVTAPFRIASKFALPITITDLGATVFELNTGKSVPVLGFGETIRNSHLGQYTGSAGWGELGRDIANPFLGLFGQHIDGGPDDIVIPFDKRSFSYDWLVL